MLQLLLLHKRDPHRSHRRAPRLVKFRQKTVETQPIVHTVQPVQQVVTQEITHTRPLAQTATEVIHHPTVEAPQTISRQAIETPTPDLSLQSTDAPINNATPIERDTAMLSTPHEVTAVMRKTMTEQTPVNSSEATFVSCSNGSHVDVGCAGTNRQRDADHDH